MRDGGDPRLRRDRARDERSARGVHRRCSGRCDDAGALPIGVLFGALAALVAIELDRGQCEQRRPWLPWVLPVMLGLPFIVDTGFVCLTRAARGQNPMIGGTDHLTHRALRKGWSPWRVLAVIAALGVVGVMLVGVAVLGWG